MKQFGIILNFELQSYFKNKVFVGITILLAGLIAAVMFFPRIQAAFEQKEPASAEGGGAEGTGAAADGEIDGMILLSAEGIENAESIRQAMEAAFLGYAVCLTEDDLEKVQEKVLSGEAECAFVLDSPTSYTYYVNNLSLYDSNAMTADEVLEKMYALQFLTAGGLTAEEAESALAVEISHETKSLGKDQVQNFFYTYIMIFALYMVILLYGQMVATSVATEKSSRAMELLITSAKPTSMMFGKVMASCLAGLIQLLIVFGSSILFYNVNSSYWEGNMIIASIFDMPLFLLIYMLIFFVFGFLIYAFMYGAIGSLASKVEDINTSAMPLTLLFIAGFLVVMLAMQEGNVDSLIMRIFSYVPFFSPMAMFTRIAMSTVPLYEILISIALLIAGGAAIGVISAKIYRVGVLLYGSKPKLSTILGAMKKA